MQTIVLTLTHRINRRRAIITFTLFAALLLAACGAAEGPQSADTLAEDDLPPNLESTLLAAELQAGVQLVAEQPCIGVVPHLILRVNNQDVRPVRSLKAIAKAQGGAQATLDAYFGTPSPTPGVDWSNRPDLPLFGQFDSAYQAMENIDNQEPLGCVQNEVAQVARGAQAYSAIRYDLLGSQHTFYYQLCSGEDGTGVCVQGAIDFSTPFELVFISDWHAVAQIPLNCLAAPAEGAQEVQSVPAGAAALILGRDESARWGKFKLAGGEQCWMPWGLLSVPPDPVYPPDPIHPPDPVLPPFDLLALPVLYPQGEGCTYTALANLFCRLGPGYGPELDTFEAGMRAEVVGQSPDGLYSYVIGPVNGHVCAVPNGEPWGQVSGSCAALPQYTAVPTSTHTPAAQQPPPEATATPTATIAPPR